ncbi:MAG: tail protein X [Planctomycetota bacterium]|nr:tail protein X [Planctomycetota bacterium]
MKRRILGITVISAGVCAALPFRNDPTEPPVDTREAIEYAGVAASRGDLTLQLTIPTEPVAAPTTVRQQFPTTAVAETVPIPQAEEVRRDDLQAPPKLASTFEPFAEAIPVTTIEATPSANADGIERLHRISDGDTLEALAERYLGDRGDWRIIFEANDGVLTNSDVLPIDTEIKIPAAMNPPRDGSGNQLVPIPPGLLKRTE